MIWILLPPPPRDTGHHSGKKTEDMQKSQKTSQAVTQKSYFCRAVLFLPKTELIIPYQNMLQQSRPLDQTPAMASLRLARCPFDVFKQFIFVIISKRRRAAIKRARYTLSAEGPSQPATLHSLFYFISLGFWLMSVTATGNKMLVRVCAVASERRLWYIVRPFASVSWLPCHWLHVYWLGVNKARASTYFALASFCKRWGFLWCGSDTLSGNINAFVVMSASLLAPFLHCVCSAVRRRAVVFTLTLVVIVANKLKV